MGPLEEIQKQNLMELVAALRPFAAENKRSLQHDHARSLVEKWDRAFKVWGWAEDNPNEHLSYPSQATPLQLFELYGQEDMGHYLQAEEIAVHRAVEVLRELGPNAPSNYKALLTEAVEFANGFPNIGVKYRDAAMRFEQLSFYGIIAFDGNPEDWENTTVRITARGYLARPEEWLSKKEKEQVQTDPLAGLKKKYNLPDNFDPDSFF